MGRLITPLGLVVGAGLLAGCMQAPADDCDAANRDITFGNLLSNELGNRYEGCLSDMQMELDRLQLEGRQLSLRASELRTQARSLSGQRRAAAERLARLNDEQAALIAQLGERRTRERASQGDLQRLLQQEQSLRSEIGSADGTASAAELERLERKQTLLRRGILNGVG